MTTEPTGHGDAKKGATNTVRLNEADLNRLHDELDSSSPASHARRKHVRWGFRSTALRVEMSQPGGITTNLSYACRNLSGTGLGILHNAYVHIGTRCTVHLPTINGAFAPLPGKVVRCRHVKGLVHEVGIQFLQPVNIREFIPVDPLHGAFTLEQVEPERLEGSILHVDPSAMDRRLVRHYLKDTSLNIVGLDDAKSALARIGEGYDLILCDAHLPDMPPAQLMDQIRAQGIQTPAILLTAEPNADRQSESLSSRIGAMVAKPVVREQLLRAIAEFLVLESVGNENAGPLYSTLRAEDPTASFVPEFIDELRQTASTLNRAAHDQNIEQIRRVCLQVKGTAAGIGFKPISDAAAQTIHAIDSIDPAKGVNEAMKAVRALTAMCQRARARDNDRERKSA